MDWAGRLASVPAPLGPFAEAVVAAERASDPTGVSKRLFELGAALPRYAVAVGLAHLASASEGPPPTDLASDLRKAARLSDGAWFALARRVGSALQGRLPEVAKQLAFARSAEATKVVEARNQFAHYGSSGKEAPALVAALLERAAPLLGAPLDAGARGLQARAGGRVAALDPWLPWEDGAHAMIDAPHTAGAPWRAWLVPTGEHRACPALDGAVRALVGAGDRPIPPNPAPPFVGHEAAAAALADMARQAAAGAVRVALVRGQAGIGRSRLLSTLVESAGAFGFETVLESACTPHRRAGLSTLRLALDAQDGLDEVQDAADRARSPIVAASAASLAAALEALEESLVVASRQAPLLWVIDDAQWMDERTVDLVLLLLDRAGRKARAKLLVAAAMRLGGTAPAAERLLSHANVAAGTGAASLLLHPLDAGQAERLVLGVAPLDDTVRAKVVSAAAGVPHWLVQPILSWHEAGALSWQDGAWHAAPETLARPVPGARELLDARISSFFEETSSAAAAAQDILAVVALHGGFTPHGRVVRAVAAAGHDEAVVLRALAVLVEAQVLDHAETSRSPRAYGFRQQLVLDAVAATVVGPTAARVHRSLLEVIAAEPAARTEAALLGRGYARLGDAAGAAHWLRVAVESSLAEGAFGLALELVSELRASGADPAALAGATLLAAEARRRIGQPKLAREELLRFDAAGASPEQRLRAHVLAALIRDALRERDEPEDLRVVAEADAHGDALLRLEARLAVARMVGGVRGMELADEAVELARDADLPRRFRAYVVRSAVGYARQPRDLQKLRDDLRVADELARAAGVDWMAIEVAMDLAIVEAETDGPRAIAGLLALRERALAAGLMRLARLALVNTTALELRTRAFAAAAEHAELAERAAREAGDLAMLGAAAGMLADALVKSGGDLDRAQRAADESVRIKRQAHDASVSLALLRSAAVAAARGDRARALEEARAAAEAARAAPYLDMAEQAALWLALERARGAEAGAEDDLRHAVERVAALGASARAATRALADEARAFLAARP